MLQLSLPDLQTEDVLLTRALRGEQNAVMEIYDAYAPPIYQYVRLRISDPDMAEDIASDVFVQFIDSLKKRTAPRHTLRGWLFRVARNLIAGHYRSHIPHIALDESMHSYSNLEAQIAQNIAIAHMQQAIRMLNDDQQEVVVLRFGQSLSLSETAEIMGKSVSAVKSLQFRAVETLRGILEERVSD